MVLAVGCASHAPVAKPTKAERAQAKVDKRKTADSIRVERRKSLQVPAPSERPIVPGAHPAIDLPAWADKTFQEMDNVFSEFTLSNPPVIGPYGICTKITFTFKGKDRDAKIRSLLCELDQLYTPQEALQLLGLSGNSPGKISGTSVNFHPADARIKLVKCYVTAERDTILTKLIEVAYNRSVTPEEQK